MSNKTIEKQSPNIAETSPDIYNLIMPLGKGLIYSDAFITLNPEDQLIDMIRELPSEDWIDELLGRLRTSQLQYIEQTLSAWLRAAEKLLGRDNTRVRKRFVELANRWHEETDYLSSPSRITNNDTYLKIISMGESVIPFILRDLQERGGDWYRALRILSDTDQVPVEDRGDVPRMKEAWLRWGHDKGYIK
jgi:hypothetical protein